MTQRYWAFLSYSHSDRRWAEWLHRSLEGYAVPRRMVGAPTPAGAAPARFRPVFRDTEDLGAAPNLSERLRTALSESAFLIVICSPEAARSRWVDEEIRRFKAEHGEARVLAAIVAGEPFASDDPDTADQECFPLALRRQVGADGALGDARIEAAAADFRPGGGGRRLAFLKLMSGLLGVGLDQLIQRDARRRHQQLLALTAASFAGALSLGGLAVVAVKERDEARAQRAQAESLVEFMVGDLRRKLQPAGRLDVLDALGERALAYYAAQERHGLDAESLGRRARVLHLLGEIRDRRGDLGAAETFFRAAAQSTGELVARRPNDGQLIFDHAQSVYWVGYMAWRRGHDEVARSQFLEYKRLAERLTALDPRNRDWQAEVGYANSNLGTVAFDDGDGEEARAAFARQLAILEALARNAPDDRERQMDLGQAYAWLADAEALRGAPDAALADRRAERDLYERMLRRTPGDSGAALALDVNRTGVARSLLVMGRTAEALAELKAAATDFERLMAATPDDISYQSKAAPTLTLLSLVLLQSGDAAQAEAVARRALALAEGLVRRDANVPEWAGPRLGAARLLRMRIAAVRARDRRALHDALAPAAAEADRLAALSERRPRNLSLARTAAEAALLAGDAARLAGDPDAALARWRQARLMIARVGAPPLPASDRSQIILREAALRLAQAPSTVRAYDVRAGGAPQGYAW